MNHKILVNMISLFKGGPKSVGLGLIEGIKSEKNLEYSWVLILPTGVGYESINFEFSGNIEILYVKYPNKRFRFLYKLFYDHIFTSYIGYLKKVDIIFMTANFASFFSSGRKQTVLQHNIHYLQDNNPFRGGPLNLFISYLVQKILFSITILYKPFFIVQLDYIKLLLSEKYKINEKSISAVSMVPSSNFYNKVEKKSSLIFDEQKRKFNKYLKDVNLFFPAKYYPNKNHILLLPIAEFIYINKLNISIFITISNKDYDNLLINHIHYKNIVINLNEIEYSSINYFYRKMSFLFFPSSSESYGMPYVEAIISRLPIITTDYPFSREICEDAAYYFNENSIPSLLNVINLSLDMDKYLEFRSKLELMSDRFKHGWGDIVHQIIKRSIVR
jgi:glycosyltransferase involved in cell wall biosynthesis